MQEAHHQGEDSRREGLIMRSPPAERLRCANNSKLFFLLICAILPLLPRGKAPNVSFIELYPLVARKNPPLRFKQYLPAVLRQGTGI
jgi:hypothetical protein